MHLAILKECKLLLYVQKYIKTKNRGLFLSTVSKRKSEVADFISKGVASAYIFGNLLPLSPLSDGIIG